MNFGFIIGHSFRYFKYFIKAKSKSSVRSPFVFDLYTKVILGKKQYYAFDEINKVRLMLENNQSNIVITDFGAGSMMNESKTRRISDVAKNSAKKEKVGEVLTAFCDYFQPKCSLEIGTSFGISSLYQYSGCKKGKWVTMEGCPQIAGIAKKVFTAFKADSIDIVVGEFSKTLKPTVEKFPQLDYVFFDGNHKKQATIDYFETVLPKIHSDSVLVFDDIHWSEGMEEAWEYIKNHPKVTVTIDLFFIGIVFFKSDEAKSNYVLKF